MQNITTGTVVTLDSSVFGNKSKTVAVYITGEYDQFYSVDLIGFEIETKSIPFYRGAFDGYKTSFKIDGLTYRAIPVRHTLTKFDVEKGIAKIKAVNKMTYDDFVEDRIKEKITEVTTLSI